METIEHNQPIVTIGIRFDDHRIDSAKAQRASRIVSNDSMIVAEPFVTAKHTYQIANKHATSRSRLVRLSILVLPVITWWAD